MIRKDDILDILKQYLSVFEDEHERQSILIQYLNNHSDEQIIDWNNFDGHIVASGFIYAQKEKNF